MPRALAFTVLLAMLVLADVPRAHHVFNGAFDKTKTVHLMGTITSVEWHNPHAWIHLKVIGADGLAASWKIACGSPLFLRRTGLDEKTLTPGTDVAIDGYRTEGGGNYADGGTVTLPDGRTLALATIVRRNGGF